jgi:mannose-6-phosphate isomerase-like protein (cupin superfamily)
MSPARSGSLTGMSSYTHLNLADVDDSAVRVGLDAVGTIRFASEDLAVTETGLSHIKMEPGTRQPFGHRHREGEELYVVIAGSGRIKVGDDVLELARLDAVRVEPRTLRCFEAGPDGLEYIAAGARHPGDGEGEAGWWSE